MRFLADMGVSIEVVRWLRSEGHDAIHLREESLQRLADLEVFRKSIEEKRILLTFDLDFGEIAALSRGMPGKIIVFRLRNTRTANVIARLSSVISHCRTELDSGAVVTVEDARYRVRLLPIGRA